MVDVLKVRLAKHECFTMVGASGKVSKAYEQSSVLSVWYDEMN